ncbi:hypothetical protein KY363_06655 [Candidatus Woesearchaeota archaeon]|nr:hypothetical protein [Candidatus Woesearchaeota archaeon]
MKPSSAVIITALLCATGADARPRTTVANTPKIIAEMLQANDQQSKALAKDGKPVCPQRILLGNKYIAGFQANHYIPPAEFELVYIDRGGKNNQGDCKIGPEDLLILQVKYKAPSGSGYSLDMKFIDAGLDGKFDTDSDRVEFFGYDGNVSEAQRSLVKAILAGRETTYILGFEFNGDQLGKRPTVLAQKEYDRHMKLARGYLQKMYQPPAKRRGRR